jgi:sarcosine oxidase
MYDAIVLGLGGVGSMALRGLARQGKGGKFLGIEAYSLLHSLGSSHGKTRIYRRAYFEHPSYVPWIEESLKIFRQMEAEHGASYLQECGTLVMEKSRKPQSSDPAELPLYCRSSFESAVEHGIPVEHLKPPELMERYPQFQIDATDDMVGILEPSGGFVRCEHVMAAALKEAQESENVEIMENSRALGMEYNASDGTIELSIQTVDDGVVVVTTKSLLVSMGAWTGQLFPSWAPHLRPIRQFQAFVQVPDENLSRYGYKQMPTWVLVSPHYHTPLFGLPCDLDDTDGCHAWLKCGVHGRDDFIPDPSANPREVSLAEREEIFDAIQYGVKVSDLQPTNQPPLSAETAFVEMKPCFYTMTKDEHFMLGTPLGYERIFAAAGLSGHGYKLAPVLGTRCLMGNDIL